MNFHYCNLQHKLLGIPWIPYKGTEVREPHFQQIDDMDRFPSFNLKFKQ